LARLLQNQAEVLVDIVRGRVTSRCNRRQRARSHVAGHRIGLSRCAPARPVGTLLAPEPSALFRLLSRRRDGSKTQTSRCCVSPPKILRSDRDCTALVEPAKLIQEELAQSSRADEPQLVHSTFVTVLLLRSTLSRLSDECGGIRMATVRTDSG